MKWEDIFLEVSWKLLYASELPRGRSNQHELNVPLKALSIFREYGARRTTADVTVFPPEDLIVSSLRFVDVVFYNARQSRPKRNNEFRLYYSRDIDHLLSPIRENDLVFFCIDIDERFRLIFLSRESRHYQQLCGLTNFQKGALWEEEADREIQNCLSLNSIYSAEKPDEYLPAYQEPLGSKTKSWYYHIDNRDFEVLRKSSRPNTIEAQVEKVAAHLARLVGIPHATIYLLISNDSRLEILSPSFSRPRPLAAEKEKRRKAKRAEARTIEVILGNRVLQALFPDYDLTLKRAHSAHTLENIMFAAARMVGKEGALQMLKYLLFDCWIGNTDRHHENWAILCIDDRKLGREYVLAPSFDHGAACAASLRAPDRKQRAAEMASFYRKGCSAVFDSEGRALLFAELAKACFDFEHLQKGAASTCQSFVRRILAVHDLEISACLSRFPPGILEDADAQFILKYLKHSAAILGGIAQTFSDLEGGPEAR